MVRYCIQTACNHGDQLDLPESKPNCWVLLCGGSVSESQVSWLLEVKLQLFPRRGSLSLKHAVYCHLESCAAVRGEAGCCVYLLCNWSEETFWPEYTGTEGCFIKEAQKIRVYDEKSVLKPEPGLTKLLYTWHNSLHMVDKLQIGCLPLLYFEWADFWVSVSLILFKWHLKRKQMVKKCCWLWCCSQRDKLYFNCI